MGIVARPMISIVVITAVSAGNYGSPADARADWET
jgi:hypothetical protein